MMMMMMISPKVNLIVSMDLEPAFYNISIQYVIHCDTKALHQDESHDECICVVVIGIKP